MSTGIYKIDFSNSEDVRTPEKTKVETITIGNTKVARLTAQPGWIWKECISPVVGTDSCEAGHVGMILKGTIKIVHDDGSDMTVSAGEAFSCAPGHDAWVVGDEEVISYEFNNSGKDYAVWKSGE